MFFSISAKTCSSQEKETESKCHMLQSMSERKEKTKVSLFLTTKVNNKSQDDAAGDNNVEELTRVKNFFFFLKEFRYCFVVKCFC